MRDIVRCNNEPSVRTTANDWGGGEGDGTGARMGVQSVYNGLYGEPCAYAAPLSKLKLCKSDGVLGFCVFCMLMVYRVLSALENVENVGAVVFTILWKASEQYFPVVLFVL